jgi:hypothetical protein
VLLLTIEIGRHAFAAFAGEVSTDSSSSVAGTHHQEIRPRHERRLNGRGWRGIPAPGGADGPECGVRTARPLARRAARPARGGGVDRTTTGSASGPPPHSGLAAPRASGRGRPHPSLHAHPLAQAVRRVGPEGHPLGAHVKRGSGGSSIFVSESIVTATQPPPIGRRRSRFTALPSPRFRQPLRRQTKTSLSRGRGRKDPLHREIFRCAILSGRLYGLRPLTSAHASPSPGLSPNGDHCQKSARCWRGEGHALVGPTCVGKKIFLHVVRVVRLPEWERLRASIR